MRGLSTFTSPTHLFPNAGGFKISARLMNGTCNFIFDDLDIKISQSTTFVKVCQPLNIPVKDYTTVKREIAKVPKFFELYTTQRFAQVDLLFNNLNKQLRLNPNVPLSFFTQNAFQIDWIEALPVNDKETRQVSIKLLIVYSNLISTISCLKFRPSPPATSMTWPHRVSSTGDG